MVGSTSVQGTSSTTRQTAWGAVSLPAVGPTAPSRGGSTPVAPAPPPPPPPSPSPRCQLVGRCAGLPISPRTDRDGGSQERVEGSHPAAAKRWPPGSLWMVRCPPGSGCQQRRPRPAGRGASGSLPPHHRSPPPTLGMSGTSQRSPQEKRVTGTLHSGPHIQIPPWGCVGAGFPSVGSICLFIGGCACHSSCVRGASRGLGARQGHRWAA